MYAGTYSAYIWVNTYVSVDAQKERKYSLQTTVQKVWYMYTLACQDLITTREWQPMHAIFGDVLPVARWHTSKCTSVVVVVNTSFWMFWQKGELNIAERYN